MSFVSLMLPDGDFLRVADPKTVAGQAAWERGRDESIQFARKPGTAVGAKLLAIVGEGSNLGDPTDPDWLPNLPAGHQVVALEQLQQLVASWHLQSGRNADGSANDAVKAAQGKAAALRLAAEQAGPQRAELLVKAAVAEGKAVDLAKAAAQAARRSGRSEAASLARAQRLLDAGRARALARAHALARSKAAVATTSTAPSDDMLYKADGAG